MNTNLLWAVLLLVSISACRAGGSPSPSPSPVSTPSVEEASPSPAATPEEEVQIPGSCRDVLEAFVRRENNARAMGQNVAQTNPELFLKAHRDLVKRDGWEKVDKECSRTMAMLRGQPR